MRFNLLKPGRQPRVGLVELVILIQHQSDKAIPSSADEALNSYPSFGQLPIIVAPRARRASYSGRSPLAKLSG